MSVATIERCYVPVGMLRTIKAHALEMDGMECCGVIGGEDNRMLMLARCGNRSAAPRHAFLIDRYQQFKAEKKFEEKRLRMIGLYHSHPTTPAQPSGYDLGSVPEDLLSLIYSVPEDTARVFRGPHQVDMEVIR